MTDYFSEDEFAPIAKAMKDLPYFAPSPQFADKVMAHVRIPGAAQVPVLSERRAMQPAWSAPVERRAPAMVPQTNLRRSIPARIAAASLVAAVGVTMSVVVLATVFNLDLFVLISRIFGTSTMSFLSALAGETSTSISVTASRAVAAASTGTGMAVVGSFAAGAVAATAALRAAATASRKAA